MKIKDQAKISIPILVVLILLGAGIGFSQTPLRSNGKIAFINARDGNSGSFSANQMAS